MAKEMKPCPWCQTTDHLRVKEIGSLTVDMPSRPYQVRCSHLDCEEVAGPVRYGRATAIEAWNRRPSPSDAGVVKALEWEDRGRTNGDVFCDTLFGQYAIGDINGTIKVFLRRIEDGASVDDEIARASSVAAAKDIAQADYEARIRSALAPVRVTGEVAENLKWLVNAWEQTPRRDTILPYLGTTTCGEVADLLYSVLSVSSPEREALEPFLAFVDAPGFNKLPDDFPMTNGSPWARRQITAGDFRRLRAALSEGE